MERRHKQLLESFERVKDFLQANTPAGASASFVAKVEELVAFVARLNALLSDQVTGRKESRDDTQRTKLAAKTLRTRHLRPISLIARGLLNLDPAARKSFAMPNGQLAPMKLVGEAQAFRLAAEKHAQLMIENGRPADFLARLDAAIEALRDSVMNRASNVGLHVGAKAGLAQELRRGRGLMQVLDALVGDTFANDAEVLARWRVAKRVKALPPVPKGTGGTADENLAPAA